MNSRYYVTGSSRIMEDTVCGNGSSLENADETLDLEARVKLPYVLKNKVLMGYGNINGWKYTPQVMQDIFNQTVWDKETCSIYYDHLDPSKPGGGARMWVGEVKNPRVENGIVLGDIHIVNKQAAIDLAYGANFGISSRILGRSDGHGNIVEGIFDNWSLVRRPADTRAYLNSKDSVKQDDDGLFVLLNFEEKDMTEETQAGTPSVEDVLKDLASEVGALRQELALLKTPPAADVPLPDAQTETPPAVQEPPKENTVSFSNEEIAGIMAIPEAVSYVGDYLSKNPDKPFVDALNAWKQHGEISLLRAKVENSQKQIEQLELRSAPVRETVRENDEGTLTLEQQIATLPITEIDRAFAEEVMVPASRGLGGRK
jgi:hypothetical protein